MTEVMPRLAPFEGGCHRLNPLKGLSCGLLRGGDKRPAVTPVVTRYSLVARSDQGSELVRTLVVFSTMQVTGGTRIVSTPWPGSMACVVHVVPLAASAITVPVATVMGCG